MAETPEAGFYLIKSDNAITASVSVPELDTERLKASVLDGGKVEILYTFRARMGFGQTLCFFPRTKEIQIRSTGFRDIITDDFVLPF